MAALHRKRNEPRGWRGEGDRQSEIRGGVRGAEPRLRLHRHGERGEGHDQDDRHAGSRTRLRGHPCLHPPEHTEVRAEASHRASAADVAQQPEQDKSFRALQSDKIFFNAQPVALVVAETYEQARYAARLVKLTYNAEPHATDTQCDARPGASPESRPPPSRAATPRKRCGTRQSRSRPSTASRSSIIIRWSRTRPSRVWEGDKLNIFDKTQGVYSLRSHLASSFGVPEENVSVVSPFVGGAFGSSLRPNYYPALTAWQRASSSGR